MMWDLPPPDPGIEISVANRGMSKGIAQTDEVQVIPKAFVQVGTVQIGGQWKNVTSPVADGEAAAFVNYTPKLGRWQLTLGAAYKFQTKVETDTDDDSLEFTAGLARKFGKASIKGTAIYSPDDLGGARRSLYLEGGLSYDIDKNLRMSANIGRRTREGSPDYISFNAGLSRTWYHRLTLDLRYYDTAESRLGENYDGRLVLSGKLGL